MIKHHEVIYSLYPEIVHIVDTDMKAYDKDWNEVQFDEAAVETRAAELQAEKETIAQAKADAKQSAHDKLAALGLTAEEIAALGK
jgi:hypothetical protein